MSHVNPPRVWDEEGSADSLALRGLTLREAEVLTWVAQGKTNYEIGVILGACTGTICKHVEHILAKLNVENRTAAAVIVLRDYRIQGSRVILALLAAQLTGLWPNACEVYNAIGALVDGFWS